MLASIGLDRSKQPSWNATTSLNFWREVNSLLGLGVVPDGAAKLLDKALEDWPVNPVFQRARKEVTAGMASSSDAAGGQQVTGRGMPSPRTSESSTSHAGDATPDMIPEASAGPANKTIEIGRSARPTPHISDSAPFATGSPRGC
ncbi:effector-associated domain EAD1-containing protein [Frankia canadensis]|uniref:effector-associated domain EAD1-containing protein n=1 Tax=Frankia canadensis TaxID=1836972 RepID=UPI003C2CE53C